MNRDRLLRLAAHLDTVPQSRFNLEHWKCGSTACAVGHACNIQEFKETGLKMRREDEVYFPVYGELKSWEAVWIFFDLGQDEAKQLFEDESYATAPHTTPAEVAARIREFCQREVPA